MVITARAPEIRELVKLYKLYWLRLLSVNPFMPNGISHCYQLDQPISVFKGCLAVFFDFIQILMEHSVYKQTVETLIRRCIVRRLVWVSTVCLCPTKRTLGLYELMNT